MNEAEIDQALLEAEQALRNAAAPVMGRAVPSANPQQLEQLVDQLVTARVSQALQNIPVLPGPPGETGQAGRDGMNGLDGRHGKDGSDGKDGKNGLPGRKIERVISMPDYERLLRPDGSAQIGHLQSGSASTTLTVQAVLRALATTPEMKGATGDGTTDDTAAFTALAAQAFRYIYLPPGKTYRVTSATVFDSPVHIFGPGKIKPELGAGGGKVFAFETNDVIVEDIEFDATGLSATLTGNTYAVYGGDGNTKFTNHVYRNIKFTELNFDDGNSGATNLLVTHALYVDNVDDVVIEQNEMDTISGAGILCRDVVGLKIANNHLTDCGWYPIHLFGGCDSFSIEENRIDEDFAVGAYWGAGIDVTTQENETRNKNGHILKNTLTGKYSYAQVIAVTSGENVTVKENTLDEVETGSLAASANLSGIRIETEGTAGWESGPCKTIKVIGNTLKAGSVGVGDGHRAIYVSNAWQSGVDRVEGLEISGNKILSADSSNCWGEGIIIHGNSGGARDIIIEDNKIEVLTVTSPVVGGAIGIVGTDANGTVSKVTIGGNHLRDIGTPASAFQTGIWLLAYVNEVTVSKPNYIDNFFYGVRTTADGGPVFIGLDNNYVVNTTNRALYGVYPLNTPAARDTRLKVTIFDDFLGDVLADQWGSQVGSDPQVVAPAIAVQENGAVRMTTGDDAAGSMAVNGVQLHSALNWFPNNGGLSAEFRIKMSATTDIAVFIGFTDQVASLEMPFTLGGSNALTSNATDAVGVLFDTGADDDNWWLVGVDSDSDATHEDSGVAPTATTYETWRIEITGAGVATFYRNGAAIGSAMTASVTPSEDLTPVVAAFSRGAASRNIDLDYINVESYR